MRRLCAVLLVVVLVGLASWVFAQQALLGSLYGPNGNHVQSSGSVTYVNSASGQLAASGTDITITLPTGAQSNDLAIACIGKGLVSGTNNIWAITPPGWTGLDDALGGGNINNDAECWYHPVGPAEVAGSTTYTWQLSTIVTQGPTFVIEVVRGADLSNPIDAHAAASNGSTSPLVAPAVTTTQTNDIILVAYFARWASFTPPTGFNNRVNINYAAPKLSAYLGDRAASAVGSYGTYSGTPGSNQYSSQMTIAIKAAPGTVTNYQGKLTSLTASGQAQVTGGSTQGTDYINDLQINQKLNIRDWGATGSQQTATCTSDGTTGVLTSCSGGDFASIFAQKHLVYVRIPQAGVTPTIATPAQPTTTSHTAQGGNTTLMTATGSISQTSTTGSCSATTNPTTLTLGAAGSLYAGEPIIVSGAGSSGADLSTTVAASTYQSTTVTLTDPCLTTVAGATTKYWNPKFLSLTTYNTVEVGQNITVCGAGSGTDANCSDGATDLITTVAARGRLTDQVLLTDPATTAVTSTAVKLGQVAYAYEIAAIQSKPNGPITAGSTASTTLNMVPQSPLQSSGGTYYNYATITGYSESNVSYYLIYKSINGGPFNYYDVTPSTSYNDYGDEGFSTFSCTDLNIPCTAPGSAVRNDVFAQITSVNAGTWTLAQRSPAPVLNNSYTQGIALSVPWYPQLATTVTIQHDDTPAFQNIYHYLRGLASPGHAEVDMPAGDYNVTNIGPYGGAYIFSTRGLSDVALQGDGEATKIHFQDDHVFGNYGGFIFSVCGNDSFFPPPATGNICAQTGVVGQTRYNIIDPAQAGSPSVTLLNAADASNFTVGGTVDIGVNASTYPGSQQHEVNAITNISGNVLSLRWPLAKQYASVPTGIWAECPLCAGVPSIEPVPDTNISRNIVVRNFWFEGLSRMVNANNISQLWIDHVTSHSMLQEETGFDRGLYLTNNHIVEDGTVYETSAGLAGTTAFVGTVRAVGNDFVGYGVLPQMCQESNYDEVWTGNNVTNRGSTKGNPPGLGLLNMGDGCFGFTATGNNFQILDSQYVAVIGFVDTEGHASVNVSGNYFHVDRVGMGGIGRPIDTSSVSDVSQVNVSRNVWQIDSNPLSIGPVVFGSGSGTDSPLTRATAAGTSGDIPVYQSVGLATVVRVGPLTGNVTRLNLPLPTFEPGIKFAIDIIQASSGGPYTIPTDPSSTAWGQTVDWINGSPPVLKTAASSHTMIWLYDDGTTWHQIPGNTQTSEYRIDDAGLLGGMTSTAGTSLLQACTKAISAGHFTNLNCVTDLNAGSCTTAPTFSVRDDTAGTNGTAKACSTSAGEVDQAETLTFAAGDIVCITRTVNGATCTTPMFNVGAKLSEP